MARKPAVEGGARIVRVFVVELKFEMPDTPNILVFGSKKAIFEYFGNDALRIGYNTALNIKFNPAYENEVCVITESKLLTINSADVIERRKREGREAVPSRNLKGAELLRQKQIAEYEESLPRIALVSHVPNVGNVIEEMPTIFQAKYKEIDLEDYIVVAKGTEHDAVDWLTRKGIECKL
jgi:hypothetical protein